MEGEQIYINILVKTLEKKISLLEQLVVITAEQEKILGDAHDDIDALDNTFLEKENIINEINSLDDGFNSVFERVGDEIKAKKDEYRSQIELLQQQIGTMTDLSVKLTAMEARNKPKFENYFRAKSNKVKEFKANSQTASSYYKNMTNQNGQSVFFDKKN